MDKLKIIGEPLPDMPWEDRPADCKDVIWRYSNNPVIPRDIIPTSNSVFNSAVVPFKGGYAGVFRCDDTNRRMRLHVGFSADVGEYRAGIIYECELEFTKQSGNSEPVKPDVNTKFQDVSQSYRREGCETDFDGGNVDASIAAAISAMRQAYSQFGYTMQFIGKNFDDIAKAEIYMLIDAGSEKEAKKFASELNGTYRSAQSGSCVIVFIFGIGTPNFAPFNQA